MASRSETEQRARLFANGGSQAVRLPRAFRLPGKEVRIRREGRAVILEPVVGEEWPKGFWDRLARLRRGLDVDSLVRPPDPLPESVEDL